MWKNKHVIVAMLVAPVLAIMGWFAVDYFVAERPHAAVPGTAYPLVARPNCRYGSGRCELVNNDFVVSLTLTTDTGLPVLRLSASHPLSEAHGAVGAAPAGLDEPRAFAANGADGTDWSLALDSEPAAGDTLRVAVKAQQSTYYAEIGTAFVMAEERPPR